jgi:RNA polymerase sigma factor (sigma-70 family)
VTKKTHTDDQGVATKTIEDHGTDARGTETRNIAVVQGIYEAIGRGAIDEILAVYREDVELEPGLGRRGGRHRPAARHRALVRQGPARGSRDPSVATRRRWSCPLDASCGRHPATRGSIPLVVSVDTRLGVTPPGTVAPVEHEHADPMLVARLCDGNGDALAEVYDRYASLVHGVARRVLGDEMSAEDVTQDVFAHLWRYPDRVDLERGNLRSYLGVMAHRRAVDALRRRARREHREARAPRERPLEASIEDAVVVTVVSTTRATKVLDALERLPIELRTAVQLAYYGGRTYREVAVELGIPEGTAKSRLRLALTRLREELTTDGIEARR